MLHRLDPVATRVSVVRWKRSVGCDHQPPPNLTLLLPISSRPTPPHSTLPSSFGELILRPGQAILQPPAAGVVAPVATRLPASVALAAVEYSFEVIDTAAAAAADASVLPAEIAVIAVIEADAAAAAAAAVTVAAETWAASVAPAVAHGLSSLSASVAAAACARALSAPGHPQAIRPSSRQGG